MKDFTIWLAKGPVDSLEDDYGRFEQAESIEELRQKYSDDNIYQYIEMTLDMPETDYEVDIDVYGDDMPNGGGTCHLQVSARNEAEAMFLVRELVKEEPIKDWNIARVKKI